MFFILEMHAILNQHWSLNSNVSINFSMGGLILDYTVSNYKGIAVFQLVINGVGGNLAAVQASRISTSLHKDCRFNNQEIPVVRFNPFYVFCTKGTSIITKMSSIWYNGNVLQADTQGLLEFC